MLTERLRRVHIRRIGEGNQVVPSLEDRIRRLEDRAEIQDLVAAYFRASDDDDYSRLEQCFTQNARFEASGFDDAVGPAGIVALIRAARAGMGQTVHTLHYVHLEFTGPDAARGVVCAHLELGLGEKTYFGAVRYLDDYLRQDAGWRLATRAMQVVYMAPWSEVETSLTTLRNVRWPDAEPLVSDFPRKPAG